MDALSISSGPNRGEAAVLGRGNQEDSGKMIIGERMRQLKEQQAQEADIKSLLGDDLKVKWTSDNVNYFQPRLEAFRKKGIDMLRAKNGKLSVPEMMELRQDLAKLKGEAEMANALYAEEQDRVKDLHADSNFKKYDKKSWEVRNEWNNPQEKYAKEIEEAGGLYPWRAKYSQAFENIGAYSMPAHVKEVFKDKLSEWYDVDDKGKLQKTYDPELGAYVIKTFKGIDPKNLASHVDAVYNDPEDWRASRMRESAVEWVDKNIYVGDNGQLSLIGAASPEVMGVIKNSPSLKGMTAEQIKKVLGKQYVTEIAKSTFPTDRNFKIEKPVKKDSEDKKSGSGEGTPDAFNWATGVRNAAKFVAPIVTPELAKKIVGDDSPEGVAKAQEIAVKHYNKVMSTYKESPYVSMTFKDGKDNPRLTYQGRQYISNGFVRKGGKWYMVGTEELSSSNSIAEMIAAIQGKTSGDDKSPKKDLTVQEIPLSADVAVKHGFTGKNAIDDLTKFLNTQVPIDIIF
jgi:hypothetical protein